MNYSVFQLLNNIAGHYDWLDDMMEFCAQDIVWLMLAVMAGMWLTARESNQKLVFYSFLSASIGLLAASQILSPLVNHARPFVDHHIHQLIPHAADASFPSDHAMLAFSLAFSTVFVKRRVGIVMLALAILTGVSRVYVGVHYPADIFGAIVLSFLVSMIVLKLSARLSPIPEFFIKIYRKMTARLSFLPHSE